MPARDAVIATEFITVPDERFVTYEESDLDWLIYCGIACVERRAINQSPKITVIVAEGQFDVRLEYADLDSRGRMNCDVLCVAVIIENPPDIKAAIDARKKVWLDEVAIDQWDRDKLVNNRDSKLWLPEGKTS